MRVAGLQSGDVILSEISSLPDVEEAIRIPLKNGRKRGPGRASTLASTPLADDVVWYRPVSNDYPFGARSSSYPPLRRSESSPLIAMLLKFLSPPEPRLTGIFIAAEAGAPLRSVAHAEALLDRGLAGDRYANGAGFWRVTDACQVTLIAEKALIGAERRSGLSLSAGEHRRNLVVTGLDPRQLEGRELEIGSARFVWHRPRPPCGYLDQVAGRGLAKALGRHSGICLKVIESGVLQLNDRVVVDRSRR